MPLRIGVLMGGLSEERDVSFSSGASIIKACEENGYKAVKIEFSGQFKDIITDVKSVDIVFIALHGGAGENGQVQSWLKKNNIRDSEMLNTFNCGVGFCLIANKKNIKNIKKIFPKEYKPYEIGLVCKKKIRINSFGKMQW